MHTSRKIIETTKSKKYFPTYLGHSPVRKHGKDTITKVKGQLKDIDKIFANHAFVKALV